MTINPFFDESTKAEHFWVINTGPSSREMIERLKIEKHSSDFISSLGHKHSSVDRRRNKPARSQAKRRKLARRGK